MINIYEKDNNTVLKYTGYDIQNLIHINTSNFSYKLTQNVTWFY